MVLTNKHGLTMKLLKLNLVKMAVWSYFGLYCQKKKDTGLDMYSKESRKQAIVKLAKIKEKLGTL